MRPPNAISQRRQSETQLLAEAMALQAEGKLLAAEARYQAILQRNPRHADANNGMGTLSIAARKPEFAIGFFEAALRERPSDFRFLNNLGNVFMQTGRTEEGLPYLERALKQRPASFELNFNIGRAYQKMGLAGKGLGYLEKAMAAAPQQADGALAMAEALGTLGRNDQAERFYRKALALGRPPRDVLFGIASGRRQTAENNVLDEALAAIAAAEVTGEDASRLHFAAAKAALDLKDAATAWQHLEAANAAAPRFDIAKHTAETSALIALFNPALMAARAALGSPSERPVFIVGMPRSGTSLTEQILSSHPQVFGAGELSYMHTLANRLFFNLGAGAVFTDQVRALTGARALALAEEYLGKIAYFSKDAPRVTDKMPHNFQFVGLIALLFPNARIVFCRRNPLDNCFSIFSNPLNESHSYGADLAILGAYYRQHIRLMDHWQALLPGRILELRYEETVADTEAAARRLLDFVGLDWDPAVLRFFETERTVGTISKWQVRQPIYTSSVARWVPFADHLGPLRAALGDLAEG